MVFIPTDLIYSILLKLPVKSLLRFKCVSKSWKTLITSPDFIHCHALSSDENRLHIYSKDSCSLYLLLLDRPLKTPITFFYSPYSWLDMTIKASSEFFLLVSFLDSQVNRRMILLNPSTRMCCEIVSPPPKRVGFLKFGIYFDEANDDLKVVQIAHSYDNVYRARIYSVKSTSWKLITRKLILPPGYEMDLEHCSVINNLFYTFSRQLANLGNKIIGCFNIQTETWTDYVPLPCNLFVHVVSVFEGSLCVSGTESSDDELSLHSYSAWVLKKNGANESWVKLMTKVCGALLYLKYFRPIAYAHGSRHVILCRRACNSELFWYNLRSKEETTFRFRGFPKGRSRPDVKYMDHLCKQSLMSLPGEEPIEPHRCKRKLKRSKSSNQFTDYTTGCT